MNIDMLGIRELKWTRTGEFNSDDHYIYYSGQESLRRNGVALKINRRTQNALLGCNLKNDTMISIHFQGKPFNITVIQVYDPKTNAKDVLLSPTRHSRVNTKKICPFHHRRLECKSRKSLNTWSNRKFGLRVQTEAGQRLTEVCQEKALLIANTFFQKQKRCLYASESPDGKYWNQIDYILFSGRWRHTTESAKTTLGVVCGSDDELIAKFRLT